MDEIELQVRFNTFPVVADMVRGLLELFWKIRKLAKMRIFSFGQIHCIVYCLAYNDAVKFFRLDNPFVQLCFSRICRFHL